MAATIREVAQTYLKLKELVNGKVVDDLREFGNNNNQAAGTRVRKAMMEAKKLAQDVRVGIQDVKNERKK